MTDKLNIIRLATDVHKRNGQAMFSKDMTMAEANDTLRQALIAANNGSTKVDRLALRDNRPTMFRIVEDILRIEIPEEFRSDAIFQSLIDWKNISAGDTNVFSIEDGTLFSVAEVSAGNQGVRRQRITGRQSVSVPTTWKYVRVYEELDRLLAGYTDWNQFIDKVAKSFKRRLLDDAYALWNGVTAEQVGDNMFYNYAGSYSEDQMLQLIGHVQAESDQEYVTIIGTQRALAKLHYDSNETNTDKYNMGYVGKFYGHDIVMVPQRHKADGKTFMFDDNVLTITATEDKPIKCVYEGQSWIDDRAPAANADMTHEFSYGEKYGMALAVSSAIGKYTIS